MTVAATTRKAGPYTGNGTTTEFAFTFKVFEASDLVVARTSDDGEVTLALNADYSVSLNSDQDNNPGGKVTLKAALEDGALLAIVSAVSYNQLAIFTNKGGFYPETLNECYDKLTILVQQLLEGLSRTIKVDVTDTMSSSELKRKLLDAAESATVVAKGYAESAKQSAEAAAESASTVTTKLDEIDAAVTAGVERITTEGDTQDARVIAEGDKQIARISVEGDNAVIANGMGGGEKAWTLSAAVAAGTAIEIPGGLKYIVNRHHLRVSWNGLVCHLGVNFNEIGEEDTYSTTFKLTFDAEAGDEIDIWIGALGVGEVADAIALAGEASAAVAELSRKVVYKEES